MISDEDLILILSAYTEGFITRSLTMELLGMTWYGDLLDAMSDAGLKIVLPDDALETMQKSINEVFAVLHQEPKGEIE